MASQLAMSRVIALLMGEEANDSAHTVHYS